MNRNSQPTEFPKDNEITKPNGLIGPNAIHNGYAVYKGTKGLDPNGIPQHTSGAKLDSGKSKTGLMVSGFALALADVAEVTTYGANKYTANGWVNVPNGIDRYTDALYRHLFLYSSGQNLDSESNLTHLSHAAWNILAIIELTERAKLTNKKYNI
jgi:hypothetical protein